MKRYIRSSQTAPYMDIPKKQLSSEQKAMKKVSQKNNQELAYDMLEQLSDTKKVQLDKFLSRNEALTSTYGCSFGNLRIYKEGWYLTLEGTRSQFSAWFFDNDGELVEGRKPNENKLHFIYEQDLRFNGVDWEDIVGNTNVTSATDMGADPQTGWPNSNWWLSQDRIDDPKVDDLLADLEEQVLNDLGVYISVYRDILQIADNRDNILADMDAEEYTDEELKLASTCRSSKEFQGKYKNWIRNLVDKE